MITINRILETDLLIVGSGIAGLSAAVEAKSKGINALLISKSTIGSGASYFPLKATLGIQVTGDEKDHPLFRADIENIGKEKINPNVIQAYIEDSPKAIALLERIGFKPWKRNDNRPACFAKYARPIYLIKDWREAALRAKRFYKSNRFRSMKMRRFYISLPSIIKCKEPYFHILQAVKFCIFFAKPTRLF